MNVTRLIVSAISMVLLFISLAHAQKTRDTLQLSKSLREEGKLAEAQKLLDNYARTHAGDLNTLWLQGNTAYALGDAGKAMEIYTRLTQLFPENFEVKLDYAKILTALGKLDRAGTFLQDLVKQHPANTEAAIYLATVYYWELRYNEAIRVLSDILAVDSGNQVAGQLLKQIREEKSPVLEMGADVNNDDQPMQTITPWIQSSLYTPVFHQLKINAGIPTFDSDTFQCYAGRLSVSNQFILQKTGLGLFLEAGIFHHSQANDDIFTGNVRLEKTFFGKLSFSAEFERRPYYLTLNSAYHPLAEHHSAVSISYGKDQKWKIKAGLDQSAFPSDDNKVMTFYSWIITPEVKFSKFTVRAGYGFNYSNANENRFTSKYSVSQMAADSISYVDGIYDPYFTPRNLQIHSLFGMAGIKPVRNLEINVKYTYGVSAVTSNPYLYLDQDENGNVVVIRDYSALNFNPYELNADVTFKISRSFSVSGKFKIFKTLYYDSRFFGVSLRKVL